MGSTLGDLAVARVAAANAAALAAECPRLDQVQGLMAGKAAASHTHVPADVTGLGEYVEDRVGGMLRDSSSIAWDYNDPSGTLSASVRLKPSGFLTVDSDGLSVVVGLTAGTVAAGDHTHSQLHDPATVTDTATVDMTLAGQAISAAVKIQPGGGLRAANSGVAAQFGTTAGTVAEGNHTHSQLHAAVTVGDTNTVDLTLVAQLLTAAVKLDPNAGPNTIPISSGGNGLYLRAASSGVAAFEHGHPNATQDAAGFMSPEDKRNLDLYAPLAQSSQVAGFSRHDYLLKDKYVGGRHRWDQDMEVRSATLTASAPTATNQLLGLEIDGVIVETLSIPTGAANAEVVNAKTFSNVFVAAGDYVRWRCQSGVAAGAEETAASLIDLSLCVRPAAGSIPSLKLNSGGSALSPYASDAYYSGPTSTASSIVLPNTTGVTSPAPLGVYQSCRRVNGSNQPLVYTLTGLARGVDYAVRLHFSEFIWNAVGDQLMNLSVAGLTTLTAANYDILAQTGGVKFKGTAQSFTVKADATGRIVVSIQPALGADGNYHCSINGVECSPA